jgi:3-oxoacyl-[acyl-carrier-protein] synthase II
MSNVFSIDNPVLITGASAITPLGLDRHATFRAVSLGQCGTGAMPALEQPLPPGHSGGQCPDLPAGFRPHLPREARYLKRAILDALADARIDPANMPCPPDRCGIVLGTTLHGMRAAGDFFRTGKSAPLQHFLAGAVLASVIDDLPLGAICATTCSACSSSLGSIVMAAGLLQAGELDLVIAGGYDTVSEYVYGGFNSLRLVATGPLRPFARERQGMKLSEGYGVVVMETRRHAAARSANPLATVRGAGESADSHHLTQPHPEGKGAARAIRAALDAAGLTAADIDLVAAHATGTRDNDAGEFAALAAVFAERLATIPVVAFKSHLGHTLGGAGAVELILSAMALSQGLIPPCANSNRADLEFPTLNLACGPAALPVTLRATLNNSLGFGGANTTVILTPPPDRSFPSPCTQGEGQGEGPYPSPSRIHRNVYITGIGVVFPGIVGKAAFAGRLAQSASPAWPADAVTVSDEQIIHLLNARRVRRMSDYVKLTLAATALAAADAGIASFDPADSWNVLLGTMHGSAGYSGDYYRQIVAEGLAAANPMLFAEGVPNSGAAHVSLAFGIQGACQTIIGSRTAGLDALALAASRISRGEWDRAIVGSAEEHSKLLTEIYASCGLHATTQRNAPFGDPTGFVACAGAVSFILESESAVQRRGAMPLARIGACCSSRFDATNVPPMLAIDSRANSHILTAANATRIDAMELATLSRSAPGSHVGSIYGVIPECFSVMPIAAIASVLLSGRLPALPDASQPAILKSGLLAPDDMNIDAFTVLCTDYAGQMSAMAMHRDVDARAKFVAI